MYMNVILSILIITILSIFVYGFVQGYQLTKDHKYDCHTIYIPEDLDVDTAFQSIDGKSHNQLKKRARELGANRQFVERADPYDLRLFILQTSISNEHILTLDLEQEIRDRDEINYEVRSNEEIQTTDPIPSQSMIPETQITLDQMREDFE